MDSTPRNSKNTNNESLDTHDETLLPSLPNHVAQLCLSSLPPSLLFSVCHSWRRLLYSPSFPPFFSLYALLFPSHNLTRNHGRVARTNSNSIECFSLDPIASSWQPLPSPPQDSPLNVLHHHPSFLSRNLSIQSLTFSNHLVLIAATTHHFIPALSCPLVFHPESNNWFFGPHLSTPRRWCATGSAGGSVYVASGFRSHYRGDVARSMEQLDLKKNSANWRWEKKAQLKNGRFCREAVEAVNYKGKLCTVNDLANTAKEGIVYDIKLNQWEDMPPGMLAGWNGPVATMNDVTMYVVDEVKGALSKYDGERDCWEKVIELGELRHAEQIAAGRGRVCSVRANGERIVVVDVVARPARGW